MTSSFAGKGTILARKHRFQYERIDALHIRSRKRILERLKGIQFADVEALCAQFYRAERPFKVNYETGDAP